MSSLIQSSGLTNFSVPNGIILVTDDGAFSLIIAVTHIDGSDPSPTNPLYIAFNDPSSGLSSAAIYTRIVAYPLKITIPSGATLGTIASSACRIWVLAYDVNGTVQLAVSNRFNAATTEVWPFRPDTAMGESTTLMDTGADLATIIYSNPAIAASLSPFRVIGNVTFSTIAIPGFWIANSSVQTEMTGPGSKRPGELVQRKWRPEFQVITGTSLVPLDDTIPTGGSEGNVFIAVSFQAVSAANILQHQVSITLAHTLTSEPCVGYVRNVTGSITIGAGIQTSPAVANKPFLMLLDCRSLAYAITAVNYSLIIGATTGGTLTMNGASSARLLGGVLTSSYCIDEIMG